MEKALQHRCFASASQGVDELDRRIRRVDTPDGLELLSVEGMELFREDPQNVSVCWEGVLEDIATVAEDGLACPLQKCSEGASHRLSRRFLDAAVLPQRGADKVQHQHCHIADLTLIKARLKHNARPARLGPRCRCQHAQPAKLPELVARDVSVSRCLQLICPNGPHQTALPGLLRVI